MPGTIETARQRARREITAAILDQARLQLAEDGPTGLSLRAVARELGMASSAVYRYFASRDELLTSLIVEAYDDLGAVAEAGAASEGPPRARWVATCRAIRRWGLDHPHQYALVFGTPVPGYAAPASTVDHGTRASRALLSVLDDAWRLGLLAALDEGTVPTGLTADLDRLADFSGFSGPRANLVAALAAWSQLYGLLSFELFGQTRNLTGDDDLLFLTTIELMADTIGLKPREGTRTLASTTGPPTS